MNLQYDNRNIHLLLVKLLWARRRLGVGSILEKLMYSSSCFAGVITEGTGDIDNSEISFTHQKIEHKQRRKKRK